MIPESHLHGMDKNNILHEIYNKLMTELEKVYGILEE